MIKVTVKEFMVRQNMGEDKNLIANSVLQFAVFKGIATVEQAPKVAGQKGEPANIYSIPEEMIIKS